MARPPKPEYILPILTEEQTNISHVISDLNNQIDALKDQRTLLIAKCDHIWVPDSRKYTWDSWVKEWTINDDWSGCMICEETGPAYACGKSPVGHCEYEGYDVRRDSCLYCGNPEERK